MFSQPSIAKCSLGQITSYGLYGAAATRLIRDHASKNSIIWPIANRALYVPFYLDEEFIVNSIWYLAGSDNTGNFDIGIYTRPGNTKIVSSGSTALGTVSVINRFTPTNPVFLIPGNYWIAMAVDNVTGSTDRIELTNALNGDSSGVLMEASAFPLPATATPVQQTTTFTIPIVGLYAPGIY